MASEIISKPSFIDKLINGGINYIKYFHGKSSSTGSAVNQSIKLLRWWCNCKSTTTNINTNNIELLQDSAVVIVENVTNGINESWDAVKSFTENLSDTVATSIPEVDTIIDENTQTLFSTLIKFGVMLLFIGCVLYVLSGIRQKITNYRTGSGITENSKTTSLVISKQQDFAEGGDVFFKQQKLQNSLTVLTPIVSQNTTPKTPVNSKEMGKRPNSNEKIVRKALSPPKSSEMLVAPIQCFSPGNNKNKTDRTQRDDASSPARTDRTQGASSPARTDPTQGASSPARTDRTQRDDASSPARTDPTQKTSSPPNKSSVKTFSSFQPESRQNKT